MDLSCGTDLELSIQHSKDSRGKYLAAVIERNKGGTSILDHCDTHGHFLGTLGPRERSGTARNSSEQPPAPARGGQTVAV